MMVRDDHNHIDARNRNIRRISITLGLVVLYAVAEVIGGLVTNSLALLADAGHMLSDAASLGLALFALWIARRPRNADKTFGYQRAEILAALVNGVALVVVAVYIVIEAWSRFRNPEAVDGRTMMWIAAGGLLVNLVGLVVLHGGRDESLNVRGAWLHVVADTLGSVQAIAAGILIWAFGWNIADPVASVLIAVLVAWSSWSLLKDSVKLRCDRSHCHRDTRARRLHRIDSLLRNRISAAPLLRICSANPLILALTAPFSRIRKANPVGDCAEETLGETPTGNSIVLTEGLFGASS